MPTVTHDEVMSRLYQEDPGYAEAVLNDLLADETATTGELLIALRQIAAAFGGVLQVAAEAQLNPTQLYRTLSAEGNPSLASFTAILKALKLRLAVKRIEDQPSEKYEVTAKKKPRQSTPETRAKGVATR